MMGAAAMEGHTMDSTIHTCMYVGPCMMMMSKTSHKERTTFKSISL